MGITSKLNSDISSFYKNSLKERQEIISKLANLTPDEKKILENLGYLSSIQIDSFIENVIGSFQLPIGIATNFRINDKDYLIPMVTEEPSVIAAASNAAKIARKLKGFYTDKVKSIMIAQIQITGLKDDIKTIESLLDNKEKILKLANDQDPLLKKLNGGAIDFEIRQVATRTGKMLVVHLLVNVLDAMGANIVNTMAEAIAPYIEELSDGKVYLRIVSNLPMYRVVKCEAVFDKDMLGGPDVIEGIMNAYEFALADPYRAATHNKGIMNGIVALALATGNDTRAIEVGAHAYASLKGIYSPLTSYFIDSKDNLLGRIEIPMTLGIIGGMTSNHPMARIALKILNVGTSEELCQVAAAVGLAQNLAALRALVSEGIQKGHMKLHSRNIAKLAGAPDDLIGKVAEIIVKDKKIRVDYAKEVLESLKKR